MKKDFNIIMTGVGGQGLITLVSIIDEAGLIEGYDVRSSELHGLSQRGGSVEIHIKFGQKVNSPLISKGTADLILGLEISESLRSSVFAGSKTKFLINNHSVVYLGGLPVDDVLTSLQKLVGKDNLYLVEASKVCQEKLDKEVLSGVYLLSYAVSKKIIPLSKESVIKAMENLIPEKYLELNKKAFQLIYD